MLRPALAFLILTLSSLAQQAGRVEGRVLSSTGEPIAKAGVPLNSTGKTTYLFPSDSTGETEMGLAGGGNSRAACFP